jgi:hypothetical protein
MMGQSRQTAPALLRRAFFFFALLGLGWFAVRAATPTSGGLSDLAQVGLPDAAGARALLERFRATGIGGDYYLEFELRALPRRGDERVYRGRLWGSRNDQGAITRIQLTDESGRTHRWLLQNGPAAAVWTLGGGQPVILAQSSLLAPLIPGVELSAFDLLMPYLYWPDFKLTRLERIRGRPAYAFVFRPPAAFAQLFPEVASVRACLDTQFNALMQAERLAKNGAAITTFSLGELKKIGEQWMLKSIDLRNESTRDKTRFVVTAAALGLEFSPELFAPARLTEEVAPPRSDRLVQIEP